MKKRATRSLKASLAGINMANNALLNFGSKVALVDELGISRATIQKFFAGQSIGRENFHKICQKLQLPWQDIAEIPAEIEFIELADDKDFNIDTVVQEVRQKGYAQIQSKCGVMRALDMSAPIALDDIYTNVNILEKISARQRLEVTDLLQVSIADVERPNLGTIIQERVPGIEAVKKYSKLIVLGKPGAGKTTFLKHIAIQCNSGHMLANLVPIFITLKDFAEREQPLSLLEYIIEQFAAYGITKAKTKQLLSHGKMLILLDGLDEVKEIYSQQVLNSISSCLTQYYANCFIITCRIAAKEYSFEQFTEVEIADFDDFDIITFITKWFAIKDTNKVKRFLEKLEANKSIRELATNPLLLTLLCLVFEELAEFPTNRSELYKEGIEILLKKWDAKRNIEREQIYKKLSVQHKKDLLGQIALTTFERGEYFFSQKTIEQYIADYISHLPGVDTDISVLQLESTAVLKSIEAQHGLLVERARGIYSFSHLTFQEYFTAREIVASSEPQVLEIALNQLVNRITEKRWREVFFLTVGMLRNADYLLRLIKQKTDQLLAQDTQLQAFLIWVNKKSCSGSVSYKPVIVRAFYFDLAIAWSLDITSSLELARLLDCNLTRELERSLALDLALDRTLALDRIIERTPDPSVVFENVVERSITYAHSEQPQLEQKLQQLKKQLPDLSENKKQFLKWWKANGKDWAEQLRDVVIYERNFGYDWQFNQQQKEVLKQYYDANQLLVECLNSNYYVTRTVRSQIENTLLLPAQIDYELGEIKVEGRTRQGDNGKKGEG